MKEFNIIRDEETVKIGNDTYAIVEMDGRERDAYVNNISQRVRVGPDGKPNGFKSLEGVQAMLLAAVLYTVPARQKVSAETIMAWPAKTVAGLSAIARRINGLNDDESENDKAKND